MIVIGLGGADILMSNALDHVYGYGIGVDLTWRDLQTAAKNSGTLWDTAKGFDYSAPCSALSPVLDVWHPLNVQIWFTVNGENR